MALSSAQKALLDAWSKTQSGFSNGQVDGNSANDIKLGTQLASGAVLDDVYRDKLATVSISIPQPNATDLSLDYPVFTALTAGQLVSVKLIPTGGSADTPISNTSTTTSNFSFVTRRIIGSSAASLNVPVPTLTGISASIALQLPSGASAALMQTDGLYSVTASGNTLRINCTNGSFASTPAVGDWVVMGVTNNQYIGASAVNAGLYLITSASTTTLLATKQSAATAPGNVVAVTTNAGSISAVRIVRQTESTLAAGDVIGVRVRVPAAAGTLSSTAQFAVQIRYRY